MQKQNIDKIKELDGVEKSLVKDYLNLIEDMVIDEVIKHIKTPTYLFGEKVYLKANKNIAKLNMLKSLYNNTKGYENKVIENAIYKIHKHYEKNK